MREARLGACLAKQRWLPFLLGECWSIRSKRTHSLPLRGPALQAQRWKSWKNQGHRSDPARVEPRLPVRGTDRKSTRLNSSHVAISYAVFCLKKKKTYE